MFSGDNVLGVGTSVFRDLHAYVAPPSFALCAKLTLWQQERAGFACILKQWRVLQQD